MSVQQLINDLKAQKHATNWFKINEGAGTSLNNSKGSAKGTINGGTWVVNGDGTKPSLRINGTSQYFTIPSSVLPVNSDFSFILRFKITSGTDSKVIMSTKSNDQNKGIYIIDWGSSTSVSIHLTGNITLALGAGGLNPRGQWNEIRVTSSARNGTKVFVNGILSTSNSNRFMFNGFETSNIFFGKNSMSSVQYLNGEYSSFVVYNVDISDLKLQKQIIYQNELYHYLDNASNWQTLTNLSLEALLLNGFDKITDDVQRSFEQQNGKQYRIYCWTDGGAATGAKQHAVPFPQQMHTSGNVNINGVESFDSVQFDGDGDVRITVSFDNNLTNYALINDEWVQVNDTSQGMDLATANQCASRLNEIRNNRNFMKFDYYLADENAWMDELTMIVSLMGYERQADNADWSFTYDQSTQTIKVNFSKDGTYTIKYLDV